MTGNSSTGCTLARGKKSWPEAQKEALLRQQFDAQDQYYREHYVGAQLSVVLAVGLPVARWPEEIRIMDIALMPVTVAGKTIYTPIRTGTRYRVRVGSEQARTLSVAGLLDT